MNPTRQTLKNLSEHWFLTEPALFALFCQQQLEENVRIECPVRCGQGRLEYNPLLLSHKNFEETEQLMRIEMIRLFLKHPYEREPEGCSREAMSIGSNITIADGYCTLHKEKLPLQEPGFYHLPMGMYYEWYAKEIQRQNQDDKSDSSASEESSSDSKSSSDNKADSPKASADHASLWREDSLQRQKINELIDRTTDWGTLPADVVETIKASTQARISNRLIWQGFQSAILNSQRKLTRMRPNRRTGFLQMGNSHQFKTRLLIAIDVSGSITTNTLEDFYSSVNRMFRYGIAQIDTCQFDADLGPIEPMQKTSAEIQVTGRGGTSFQPLFDYIKDHKEYDGLIILTDGQAPPPETDSKARTTGTHILWVCKDKAAYEAYHEWMEQSGRCCHL